MCDCVDQTFHVAGEIRLNFESLVIFEFKLWPRSQIMASTTVCFLAFCDLWVGGFFMRFCSSENAFQCFGLPFAFDNLNNSSDK